MLNLLVRQSIARPWLVVFLACVLAIFGTRALLTSAYDVFPDFVPAQATVQTEAPGLTPEQVETFVTKPLEDALGGATGVEAIRSDSIQGLSIIQIVFNQGADPFKARQIVAEKLGEVAGRLPSVARAPLLTPLTSSTMDLLKIGFTSDKLNPQELRDFVQWTLRPQLLGVPGVARANIFGGQERQIEVAARIGDLRALNVTLADITASVRAATDVRGAGYIETTNQRLLIEATLPRLSAQDIASAPLIASNARDLRISDVADVRDGTAAQFGDALVMGRPGVLLNFSSQFGANTLDVTRAVEAELKSVTPLIEAKGIVLYPALHRPANFIETGLSGLAKDLILGAFLIALVLWFFMANRLALGIALIAIPLSLLAAVLVLNALHISINTMTLGGLAVALGVVIDDAIIDIENILRRLALAPPSNAVGAVIADASIEVRAPVVYATLIVALTLLPVLLLKGVEGAFFAPLAFAFLLAIAASLLVAMTVTPALARLLLKLGATDHETKLVTFLKAWHGRVLVCLMKHWRIAIGLCAGAVIISATILPFFGGEFLPSFRERHYVAQMFGPAGTSIETMRVIGAKMSDEILKLDTVASVEMQIGRAEAGEDTWGPERSEFHIELKKINGEQDQATQDELRKIFASQQGFESEVLTFLGDRIGETLSGETAQIAIILHGVDLNQLDQVAGEVAKIVGSVQGAADVRVKSEPGAPIIKIALDPTRLSVQGLSAAAALEAVQAATQGTLIAQVADGRAVTNVNLAMRQNDIISPSSVANVPIRDVSGRTTTLADVATVSFVPGRSIISHENGQRRQVVTLNSKGRDVAGLLKTVQSKLTTDLKLPDGVWIGYAGAAKGQAEAASSLLFNTCIMLVGLIAVLVVAFGGARPAFLILAGAPFAMLGGVVAVGLSGAVLSLGAMVGFVTLFGVSARNAILLVSHVDHIVTSEDAAWNLETVMRATSERVAPVLMTAAVTMLAILP